VLELTWIAAEHITEGNTPSMFFTNRNQATLSSGQASRFAAPPLDFFTNFLLEQRIFSAGPFPEGLNPTIPIHRLAETLGSRRNIENFLILLQLVNLMKAGVRIF
jgi:hypothetical protein